MKYLLLREKESIQTTLELLWKVYYYLRDNKASDKNNIKQLSDDAVSMINGTNSILEEHNLIKEVEILTEIAKMFSRDSKYIATKICDGIDKLLLEFSDYWRNVDGYLVPSKCGCEEKLKDDCESMVQFGDLYPADKFYVIRCTKFLSSLGPLMEWVYEQLFYIEQIEDELIPVIDFSINWNPYLRENEVGIVNPWTYFFEQPSHYDLKTVYNSQNVILGNAYVNFSDSNPVDRMVDNLEYRKKCAALYGKYIFISNRIVRKVEELQKELFSNGKRVLGVTYRGTDYRNRPVVGEHRQPSIEELTTKAEKLLKKWECDLLFLTTEDASATEIFKEQFGERLRLVPRLRYPSDVAVTWKVRFEREHDEYIKGEDYLIEIILLSKCNCLLSSRIGMLLVTLPLNNCKYENEYIYNLGIHELSDYNL